MSGTKDPLNQGLGASGLRDPEPKCKSINQLYMSYMFADSLRAASCQQTCVTYATGVYTVKNSWLLTEELPETCRILFQK